MFCQHHSRSKSIVTWKPRPYFPGWCLVGHASWQQRDSCGSALDRHGEVIQRELSITEQVFSAVAGSIVLFKHLLFGLLYYLLSSWGGCGEFHKEGHNPFPFKAFAPMLLRITFTDLQGTHLKFTDLQGTHLHFKNARRAKTPQILLIWSSGSYNQYSNMLFI